MCGNKRWSNSIIQGNARHYNTIYMMQYKARRCKTIQDHAENADSTLYSPDNTDNADNTHSSLILSPENTNLVNSNKKKIKQNSADCLIS